MSENPFVVGAPRRTPALRYRPRRNGSVWLAQKAKGASGRRLNKTQNGRCEAAFRICASVVPAWSLLAEIGVGPSFGVRQPSKLYQYIQ